MSLSLSVGLLVGLALAGLQCSSNGAGAVSGAGAGCQADPTQCPAEQTCWPTSATTFGCIASKPGAGLGASCVEAYNQATCADGLLCDATNPDGTGQCAQYCGTGSQCPNGYSCRTTQVGTGGLTVGICRVAPPTVTTPIPDAGEGGETYEGGELPDIYAFPDVVSDGAPARQ